MRDAIRGLGFEVVYAENADRSIFVEKLHEFARRIEKDDTAFFFFAGHGVSLNGENYLLSSDSPTPRNNVRRAAGGRLADFAIAETSIVERITTSGAGVTVCARRLPRQPPANWGSPLARREWRQ